MGFSQPPRVNTPSTMPAEMPPLLEMGDSQLREGCGALLSRPFACAHKMAAAQMMTMAYSTMTMTPWKRICTRRPKTAITTVRNSTAAPMTQTTNALLVRLELNRDSIVLPISDTFEMRMNVMVRMTSRPMANPSAGMIFRSHGTPAAAFGSARFSRA